MRATELERNKKFSVSKCACDSAFWITDKNGVTVAHINGPKEIAQSVADAMSNNR